MIRTTGDNRDTRVVACAGFRLFNFVSSFDAHRNAHAAADAERGEALIRIALLHFSTPACGHDTMRASVVLPRRPLDVLVGGGNCNYVRVASAVYFPDLVRGHCDRVIL
jgi:hypothetical protein